MEVDLESNGFTTEEFAEIKLNLETLYSIRAGGQPFDRNLGIDYDGIVDYPLDVAKNMLALEIIEKTNIYEPRVEVESVEIDISTNGQLIPHIHLLKAEG